MNREKLFKIAKKLAAFEFGQLQDVLTCIEILERNGFTIEDFRVYVEETISQPLGVNITETGEKVFQKSWPRCPDHDIRLALSRIPENDRGLRTRWFCPVMDPEKPEDICGFERLDPRPQDEIFREFYINHEIEIPEAS